MSFSLNFSHALGAPASTGVLRQIETDFQVVEHLGFEPSGHGEHCFLQIRKRGENTQWLAGQIARFVGVSQRDVGFAGLKDRRAETTQWFSVYLPSGAEPDWNLFATTTEANIDLLAVTRHNRKLRRGEHSANHFTIRLTNLQAAEDLPHRLEKIVEQGVPNYFGEQRFGHDANNLALAAEWLEHHKPVRSRNLRGIVMSAARSWLFNRVLSERVAMDNWCCGINGDVLCDDASPSGPLWGRGRSPAQGQAREIEQAVMASWPLWALGLEHCGLSQERRSLVLTPQEFQYKLDGGVLTLRFALAPGQFATAVLREVAQLTSPAVD